MSELEKKIKTDENSTLDDSPLPKNGSAFISTLKEIPRAGPHDAGKNSTKKKKLSESFLRKNVNSEQHIEDASFPPYQPVEIPPRLRAIITLAVSTDGVTSLEWSVRGEEKLAPAQPQSATPSVVTCQKGSETAIAHESTDENIQILHGSQQFDGLSGYFSICVIYPNGQERQVRRVAIKYFEKSLSDIGRRLQQVRAVVDGFFD